MPRLSGGAGAQSALAQAPGGVPPRSTSSGQLPESQVAPCGAASAVARPYGVPESGQTSHNGGVLVRRGFRDSNSDLAGPVAVSRPFSEWATTRTEQVGRFPQRRLEGLERQHPEMASTGIGIIL